MAIKKPKLLRKAFIAWLRSKPPSSIVGRSNNCCYCPIAVYLATITKVESTNISVRDDCIDLGPWVLDTPVWVEIFIQKVDALKISRVTAKRALTLLNAV